ncbi:MULTISPECIES: 50S ribosomal protein L11 methyltransferase [Anaerosinus]|uniref:Ribosomal protein L11 methyltransferase n=1 Tax=Selenobaculum gibii TaxID=3054208 RepID=A0A9Y2AH56_9FIRM|nr:50S ribosomal protein L11 methyltransferase [Selenobaculum gbiensis]WIW69772.1 50S ribosomal protein L11 methyltransferase [Selenobaculum gbiensis]
MKWAEISIKTTHEATEVIAEIFHEVGASGVVIEDPALVNEYRASGAWDYTDIPEATNTEIVTVKAYLPVDEQLDDKLAVFKNRVDELAGHNIDKGLGDINCTEIQDEDWSTTWKEYFHPIKVGDLIVIKPSWEEYNASPDDIIIELDPGMAFGTGTHHTTSMCIRLLEEIIKGGQEVFDVGTGSGVLAITAAKLGAMKVTAVDFDPVAVRVAKENIEANHVSDIITTGQSDLLKNVDGKADVIIANIIADIIIRLLDDIPNRLKLGGTMIASGIIADRLSDVTKAVIDHGLTVDRVIEEGGWVAMVIHNGGN